MGAQDGNMKELQLFRKIQSILRFEQPHLRFCLIAQTGFIYGNYLVMEPNLISHPSGPLTQFDIEILITEDFPVVEPIVYEVGGRIPRIASRHINTSGDCCIGVWEEWLNKSRNPSFLEFIQGPLNSFFFSQYYFEMHGIWPFGEREHGKAGYLDALADIFEIEKDELRIRYILRLLAKKWPKGHWPCPCGSEKILRYCHKGYYSKLHNRISPAQARKMLIRLDSLA